MSNDLPTLDGHAHLAPDVTPAQVRGLGDAYVFAVTRSLGEAEHVRNHPARNLLWGLGTHPSVAEARRTFDEKRFRALLPSFGLVGEIGLDNRGGDPTRQVEILSSILRACTSEPVLLSIHSAGRTRETLDLLHRHPQRGAVLHWWASDGPDLDDAIDAGCYFSVNSAMTDAVLRCIPIDRIITETDFPARRVEARKPGDTLAIENRLAEIHASTRLQIRRRVWGNLQRIAQDSGALDRLPQAFADRLASV